MTFDAASNSGGAVTGSVLGWSHTCTNAGILVVGIEIQTTSPLTCTANGIPMSRGPVIPFALRTSRTLQTFYLENPPTGTLSIQGVIAGSTLMAGVAASWVAGNSMDSFGSAATNGGGSSPLTVSSVVKASNCWLVGIFATENSTPASISSITSNVTNRASISYTGPSSVEALLICDSNGTVGTGSQSIQGTVNLASGTDAVQDMAGIVLSISPPVSSTANPLFFAGN